MASTSHASQVPWRGLIPWLLPLSFIDSHADGRLDQPDNNKTGKGKDANADRSTYSSAICSILSDELQKRIEISQQFCTLIFKRILAALDMDSRCCIYQTANFSDVYKKSQESRKIWQDISTIRFIKYRSASKQ